MQIEKRAGPKLLRIDEAVALIAQCRTVDEAKQIRDKAEAMRVYLRTQKQSLIGQNDMAEIKLRAERRLGELLADQKAKGDRRSTGGRPPKNRSHAATDSAPTLKDLGIEKTAASRWQELAKIPAPAFEGYVKEQRATAQGEITSAGIRQEYRGAAKLATKAELAAQLRARPIPHVKDGPFPVIVLDPPWRYEKRVEDATHRGRNPYPDMSIEEICALPIRRLADDNCVLWLWTTNAFMREAFRCLDAWGFREKTILTWAKDRMGTGDWLRGQTEHAIMSVLGAPTVTLTNQTTLLNASMREHSRKPDEFYSLVDALCPGPKLEMFAREKRDGWSAWGAEVERFEGAV